MENEKTFWSDRRNQICSLCVFLCAVCVCIAFKKKTPMSLDLMAVLVGVLSFLVAVLAIFLAINYLVFEKKMKEYVENAVGDLERKVDSETGTIKIELESQVNDISHAAKSYFIYANSGSFIVSSMHSRLIGCLDGLKEEEYSKRKYALNAIMEEFVSLIPRLSENERYLPVGTKKEYLNMIKRINHSDTDTIFNFVYGLNEKCITDSQEEEKSNSNAIQVE